MRKLLSLVMVFMAMTALAQSTTRKFVLKNSADGESELTVYLPSAEAAAKANGRAVVDCPGGGYSHLAMDHEGHQWAEYFNSKGIAYAVLKYRMPNGDRNIPLTDAYNAIKTMRDSAQVWNVNPRNVGIMGFSAGGHLASSVSTHAEFDVRPNFTILFYPVISMNEKESHKGSCVNFLGDLRNDEKMQKEWTNSRRVRSHLTPPAIILLANDDRVVPPVTNGVAYYNAMRKVGNVCELHVYPSGGHGFGIRSTYKYHDRMLNDLSQWLEDTQMPKQDAVKVACIGNSITYGSTIDMNDVLGYPAVLQRKLGDGYDVRNFGLGGRTMCNNGNMPYMKEWAWKDVLAYQPDVVIIKLGTNDTKPENKEVTKADYEKDCQEMIDALNGPWRCVKDKWKILNEKGKLVTPKGDALKIKRPIIYLCSPIPCFKPTWGMDDSIITDVEMPALKRLVEKNQCRFIDLHTEFANDGDKMSEDAIHPNDKGAARMAEIIYEKVK